MKSKATTEASLERELWELLFQHFQAEHRNWSAVCKEFGLTLPQAHLLRLLTKSSSMKMNVLADALDCDASNITGLVDKLETRGLIRRQLDREDRRVKLIALTPVGAKITTKVLARLAEPSPSITELSLPDKKALYRIVGKMVLSKEAEAGALPSVPISMRQRPRP